MDKTKSAASDSNFFIVTAVSIGGALEWYEVGLFISWQLIVHQDATSFEASIAESLNAISVLALVGWTLAFGGVRILGGWFFGRQGDRRGRRVAFPLTILISSLPSFSLFILSFFLNFKEWIVYSTGIFTLIKFFQGIPAGGELPGAICYLAETDGGIQTKSIWASQRYICSYALLGSQLGLALSALVCLLLKFVFPVEILLEKGWRYVFLASGLMGIGGFVMRKKLHETAAFLRRKVHHGITYSPVKTVFSKYLNQTLFGLVLPIFDTVLFSALSVMPLYYAQEPFNLSPEQTILLTLVMTGLGIVLLPLIGYISGKYMKFPWLKTSAWGVFVLSFFLYKELVDAHLWSSLLLNLGMVIFLSIQAAILPSILAQLFPVNVRYTGIAFSFNICDGILWTIMTSVCFFLISKNSPVFVLFLPVSALLFLITLWVKGRKGVVGSLLN